VGLKERGDPKSSSAVSVEMVEFANQNWGRLRNVGCVGSGGHASTPSVPK